MYACVYFNSVPTRRVGGAIALCMLESVFVMRPRVGPSSLFADAGLRIESQTARANASPAHAPLKGPKKRPGEAGGAKGVPEAAASSSSSSLRPLDPTLSITTARWAETSGGNAGTGEMPRLVVLLSDRTLLLLEVRALAGFSTHSLLTICVSVYVLSTARRNDIRSASHHHQWLRGGARADGHGDRGHLLFFLHYRILVLLLLVFVIVCCRHWLYYASSGIVYI